MRAGCRGRRAERAHHLPPTWPPPATGCSPGCASPNTCWPSGRPLAELAGEVMTSYPQVLVNVRVAERHPHVADELAAEIAAAEDALAGEGRVLLRASGTEPLIRVMVEAATAERARSTAELLAGIVRRSLRLTPPRLGPEPGGAARLGSLNRHVRHHRHRQSSVHPSGAVGDRPRGAARSCRVGRVDRRDGRAGARVRSICCTACPACTRWSVLAT